LKVKRVNSHAVELKRTSMNKSKPEGPRKSQVFNKYYSTGGNQSIEKQKPN
jgi:hypothetical protein